MAVYGQMTTFERVRTTSYTRKTWDNHCIRTQRICIWTCQSCVSEDTTQTLTNTDNVYWEREQSSSLNSKRRSIEKKIHSRTVFTFISTKSMFVLTSTIPVFQYLIQVMHSLCENCRVEMIVLWVHVRRTHTRSWRHTLWTLFLSTHSQ